MTENLLSPESLPILLKPRSQPRAPGPSRFDLSLAAPRPVFLKEVVSWDVAWQRLLFRCLLPVKLLAHVGVDPLTLTDQHGRPVAHLIVGEDGYSIRIEIYASADDSDAMLEMELSDTSFNQIEFVWLAAQDTRSQRYDVDFLPSGQLTMRGVAQRNVPAETEALRAGLAPGQIYRGLGITGRMIEHLESFMLALNQREIVAQPLFYHTAILFERSGFSYMQGQGMMERVHQGFLPGGDLRGRLDASTPFRQPELADTVRGRSWAIHDGLLGDEWTRVRMIRRLGGVRALDTSQNLPW